MRGRALLAVTVLICGCITGGGNGRDPLGDCPLINNEPDRDSCYVSLARQTNNPVICDSVRDRRFRDGCFINLASASGDESVCEKVRDAQRKDGCYLKLALAERDYGLCMKIANLTLETGCTNRIRQASESPPMASTAYLSETPTTQPPSETTSTTQPPVEVEESTTTSTTETTTTSTTTSTTPTTTSTSSTTTIPRRATTTTLAPPNNARVFFLDVGYGESSLVKAGNASVLINCGKSLTKILNLLEVLNVTKIDYLVVTQPSEEDYSACATVMKKHVVKHVLDTGQEPASRKRIYGKYYGYAQITDYKAVSRGYAFTAGNLSFQVLHPDKPRPEEMRDSSESMVLKMTYGSNTVLFTGDCDSACDKAVKGDVAADLVTVPNHGQKRTSSPSFLYRVRPQAAILSHGPASWDTPPFETMNALKKIGADIYYIELTGTLDAEMVPEKYSIAANPYMSRR
jgi:competence protein ComEC